jgi:hypothetical protein
MLVCFDATESAVSRLPCRNQLSVSPNSKKQIRVSCIRVVERNGSVEMSDGSSVVVAVRVYSPSIESFFAFYLSFFIVRVCFSGSPHERQRNQRMLSEVHCTRFQ